MNENNKFFCVVMIFCARACVVSIVAGQARSLNAKPLSKKLTCRSKCSSMLWIVQHKYCESTRVRRYVSTLKLCAWLVGWLVRWLWTYKSWYIAFFQDIASYIKKEFDRKYNPTWNCIAGTNFWSWVKHKPRHYIFFDLGEMGIVLFKSE